MGPRLSLLAPSAPTVAISSYIDVLKDYQYLELINNSRFLKTIKAVDKTNGNLVIIKVLIKPQGTFNIQLEELSQLLSKESQLLSQFNNVLPWHKIIETDRAGYLVRQLIKTNLYDRISLRPFMEPIEKLFLVFQMLTLIADLHDLGVHHGDLKLENFLVTSSNWPMLADFASSIKPVFIPEDNPNQFSFYFDTSDRRVCYLAPERFYDEENELHNNAHLTDEMDLFSLGCVIAELYSDGEPTFTLSQLFKFVKHEFIPDLSNIRDSHMKNLVKELIQHEPGIRTPAKKLLKEYRKLCFPDFFYTFLYDFMSDLNNNNNYQVETGDDSTTINDIKIEKIYSSLEDIVKALKFEYQIKPPSPDAYLKLNLPGLPRDYVIQPVKSTTSSTAALILLNLIFSLMKTAKKVSSKLKACELIIVLSERINDGCKLDRSLPYICLLLDEFTENATKAYHSQATNSPFNSSCKVICMALKCITTLLLTCSYITPINVLIFPEYLLPKLTLLTMLNIPKSDKDFIKLTLASCLPYLASVSKKFWMMSKTFKSDALKEYNSKIMNQSTYGSSTVPDLTDESYSTFSIPKDELDKDFQKLTIDLLTDANPLIKISLLNNILPLCQFLGIEKTNDLILPHLIAYLNDTNFQLRLAFLSLILQIGPYVGVLSFEQYVLPLLIQTLGDLEQFVVLKVLQIFNEFVQKRIINPKTEFNALEIYKELVVHSINLLLHPNEWIRQSVIQLIISISDNLGDADRYCFLYPLIKGFLSYDLSEITWSSLYPSITSPLSKPVYELAITWCINSTSKSLFWQEKNVGKHKQVTAHKNMGKSVYLPRLNTEVIMSNGSKSSVPLSAEDKQWLIRLKSIGLEDNDLWKVFILRDYLYRVSKGPVNTEEEDFNTANLSNVIPRNIFFDIFYKSELLTVGSKTVESIETLNPADSVLLHDFETRLSLILPNFNKFRASIQTVEANVFGELEISREIRHNPHNNNHHHGEEGNSSTYKVFSVNNLKIITTTMKHSYKGYNPYIFNYLNNVEFEPTLDSFPEFGSYVKSTNEYKKSSESNKETWQPKGLLIAKIDANTDGEIDGINCVEVGPTLEFFITGSERGYLKVWDTYKMEKAVSIKNSSVSLLLKSSITSIKFIANRFCFVVTTTDGKVRFYRIDATRSKNRRIKLLKLVLIREHQLDEGYILKSELAIKDELNWLIAITSTSKVVIFDIIKMQQQLFLQNPVVHGIPTTFYVGERSSWLVVGTDKGVLSLWDLRFKLLIKSWKVKSQEDGDFKIHKLISLQSENSFAMIGGSNECEITVWEISKLECKQVFSAQNGTQYSTPHLIVEVKNDVGDISVDDILQQLQLNVDSAYKFFEDEYSPIDRSFTALRYSGDYFLSATWDRRIILWNREEYQKSVSVNSIHKTEFVSAPVNQTQLVHEISHSEIPPIERSFRKLDYKLNDASRMQDASIKTNQDLITDLDFITKPLGMIVSVDRSGCIYVYK